MRLIERFEIGKMLIYKLLFIALIMLSLFALLIQLEKNENIGIPIFSFLVFTIGYLFFSKEKLVVDEKGLVIVSLLNEKSIEWSDVLLAEMDVKAYFHYSVFYLHIYTRVKYIPINTNFYGHKDITRLCEILTNNCKTAKVDENVILSSLGKFTWKEKLKMFFK